MSQKSKTSSTTQNPYATQQYQSAVGQLNGSQYKPVTSDQINGYMNPYTSDVINATTAQNNQNQALALNQNKDAAIKAGAFDTSGLGVQNALTQGQFALANNQTTAGLNAANYDQASSMAQNQNAAQNQYPLLIQSLLGNLAQGTQTNSSGTQSTSGTDSYANLLRALGGGSSSGGGAN